MILQSFLIKFKLNYYIFFIEDVWLRGINPSVSEILNMVHFRDIVIHNEVLETVRNVTRCNPNSTRASNLRLDKFLLFLLLWDFISLFLWRSAICGVNIEWKVALSTSLLLWRSEWWRIGSTIRLSHVIKQALLALMDLISGELTYVVDNRVSPSWSLDLNKAVLLRGFSFLSLPLFHLLAPLLLPLRFVLILREAAHSAFFGLANGL